MQSSTKTLPQLTALAAFVASALSYGAVANTLTPVPMQQGPMPKEANENIQKVPRAALQRSQPAYFIVELEDAPLATYSGGVRGLAPTARTFTSAERLETDSVEAIAYTQYLQTQQARVASALQAKLPSLSIERNFNVTLNGFVVSVPRQDDVVAQLQSVTGVKKVYENEIFYTQMDASLDIIKAPTTWAQAGGQDSAGAGVKVAVIDTGITPHHPMFSGVGHERPEGLPTDDYCATQDPTFCNSKLVVARYYEPLGAAHPDETLTPKDFGGHGTHVAGTAVGNAVYAEYDSMDVNISGVAPGASLMVYKALYINPQGQGTGSSINLASALEDAVADGADVINNSWGGGAGGDPSNSVYRSIFTNAEAAGVVLVTAAGNDGPGAQTVGCPGCVEAGITVASTQTGRVFGSLLTAPGVDTIYARPGSGNFELSADITAPLLPAMEVDEANALACEPFPAGAFEGSIAFISRGECSFGDKANHAEAAGAVAMVLYNNAPGGLVMSMPDATLPSVSISQEQGESVLEAWTQGSSATITRNQALFSSLAKNSMSDFSSRGPNGDSSFLKPEIAAPGSDILSAYPTEEEGVANYQLNSGTSMASPHVAGAAAVLRQMRPELNAFEIKSILMTSSNPEVKNHDSTSDTTPFDRGAGLMDMDAASKTAISFDKPSFVSPACVASCSFERTVTNLLAEEGTWYARVEFVDSHVTGTVSTPSIELAPTTFSENEEEEHKATANFTVNVDTTYADEGWTFGQVVFTDSTGQYPTAHMPIAVMARQSDDTSVLTALLAAGEVTADDLLGLSVRAGYPGSNEDVTVTAEVPEGTNLVLDSVQTEMSLATETSLTVSEDQRTITWTGQISQDEGAQLVEPSSDFLFAGATLADLGITDAPTLPCESSRCDELPFDMSIGEYGGFIWNGKLVEEITISPNGFITAAPQSYYLSYNNTVLPTEDAINAIIAPFWSDLVVGGEHGGQVNFVVANDGTSDWLVFEWQDVTEAKMDADGLIVDPTATKYTFSIWLKMGSDEVYFNYVSIPEVPDSLTVGIEDITGTKGFTYYYANAFAATQGTAPVTGEALRAGIAEGEKGFVFLNYQVEPSVFGAAQDTDVSTVEQEPVTIDLTNAFTTGSTGFISKGTLVTAAQEEYRSIQPFSILPSETAQAVIATEPEHGAVVPVEGTPGQFVYTAEAGFVGTDSFTFVAEGVNGQQTTAGTVTVVVERDNTAPVAKASVDQATVRTGAEVTLSAAESSDVDGDTLSFTWSQVGGPDVSLANANTVEARFIAPSVQAQTDLTFEVSVSDGYETRVAQAKVTVLPKESKKWYEGSFGAFIAALALPLVWLRRRRHRLQA
ncbi:hypothetical protein CWE15_07400 [Aliidiomarina taiwanensis]|uniref:Peptidase S8 n=1 Tax=Aliidiomarina taiwanensis TaxID=946228 RepID=A0A432X1V3_9GAMM|nr:S8 family serine peptidase [Aliidiomarina taiwanensis]RUO40561.1 hypothetical protein CWE15_07400 [Aliidiomarina taiwanensis]